MAVCEIWDVSPLSFFINFWVISKLIKNNLGDKSQITLTAMWLLIQIEEINCYSESGIIIYSVGKLVSPMIIIWSKIYTVDPQFK